MRLMLTAVLRKRTPSFQGLLLLRFCVLSTATPSQFQAISATINVTKPGAPISRNIYEPVLEHSRTSWLATIWPCCARQENVYRPHLWRIGPNSIDATLKAGSPAEVRVEEQSLGALPATVTLRPFSINIYSYPVH